MILIEKLRIKATPKNTPLPCKSIGLIDFFHSDLYDARIPHFWHCTPQILRSRAEQYLEEHNILLAAYAGVHGISPWAIDHHEAQIHSQWPGARIVYEIDIDDFVDLPPPLQRRILRDREVLFTDLTEGVMWGKFPGKFFTAAEFEARRLEARRCWVLTCDVGASINQEIYPAGVKVLTPANSFAPITISNQGVSHLLEPEHRQEHLERIDQAYARDPEYIFMSINGKPRRPRLQILADMWRRGLLEKSIWSLGFYPSLESVTTDRHYVSVGHSKFSDDITNNQTEIDFVQGAGPWPRLLEGHDIHYESLVDTPLQMLETAAWYTLIETVVTSPADKYGELGRPMLITEKFYKSVILGMPAVVIGWQNAEEAFEQLGYQLPDLDYSYSDSANWDDRRQAAVELLSTLTVDRRSYQQRALDNFELLTDQDHLVRTVCEPVLQIRECPGFKA